jgi:2-keto-4-pentenoate hydratase
MGRFRKVGSSEQSTEATKIAEAFVSARRNRRVLEDYPGTIPANLADAYAVQEAAIDLYDTAIGGWKVGKINPPLDGVDRLVGPIFVDGIVEANDASPTMPIFAGGFGAAEAEYLLRIGRCPPEGKRQFTRDEAIDLIDAVHVGVEVASSPFGGINELGATVTISDFGNNNGLVIGKAIPEWRDGAFEAWPVELIVNGAVIGAAAGSDMLDGPIGAARFLFEMMAARGIALEPGQWISSGAVTGVHEVVPGDRVTARFNNTFEVGCVIRNF